MFSNVLHTFFNFNFKFNADFFYKKVLATDETMFGSRNLCKFVHFTIPKRQLPCNKQSVSVF